MADLVMGFKQYLIWILIVLLKQCRLWTSILYWSSFRDLLFTRIIYKPTLLNGSIYTWKRYQFCQVMLIPIHKLIYRYHPSLFMSSTCITLYALLPSMHFRQNIVWWLVTTVFACLIPIFYAFCSIGRQLSRLFFNHSIHSLGPKDVQDTLFILQCIL